MAYVVKTDTAHDQADIKTKLEALITGSTITTYHESGVIKDGSQYLVYLVYEGT
jgi:hypothetical protein